MKPAAHFWPGIVSILLRSRGFWTQSGRVVAPQNRRRIAARLLSSGQGVMGKGGDNKADARRTTLTEGEYCPEIKKRPNAIAFGRQVGGSETLRMRRNCALRTVLSASPPAAALTQRVRGGSEPFGSGQLGPARPYLETLSLNRQKLQPKCVTFCHISTEG